jgi:pilus assembly protein CpaF
MKKAEINFAEDDGLRLAFNSLAPLREHFADPEVQEVMINGANNVFIERAGAMYKLDVDLSEDQILSAATLLASRAGKELKPDSADCVLNERWPGVRVCCVLPPVSLIGPVMSIRKHSSIKLTLDNYLAKGVITEEVKDILVKIVKSRQNVLIVGGTGTGKTTFFKALIDVIDDGDRIMTIEDLPELDVQKPNVIAMETRDAVGIDYTFLVQTALRMRPDRILLGEVRGKAALDLLNAANTGHEGCISTFHANSSFDALARFEDMVMQSGTSIPLINIQQRIAQTFKYVVFMVRHNFQRHVEEVLHLHEFDLKTQFYKFDVIYRRNANEKAH